MSSASNLVRLVREHRRRSGRFLPRIPTYEPASFQVHAARFDGVIETCLKLTNTTYRTLAIHPTGSHLLAATGGLQKCMQHSSNNAVRAAALQADSADPTDLVVFGRTRGQPHGLGSMPTTRSFTTTETKEQEASQDSPIQPSVTRS